MLREVFSKEELQKKAARCGFYKRKSDFTPAMFFDILLYCASRGDAYSLSQVSSRVKSQYRLRISKQSIDDRFTTEAVVFAREMLKELLEKQLRKILCKDFLPQFNHVRIKDSTRFGVPDRLREHFKGFGGSKGASRAHVSIQYEYDARSGKVLDLNLTSATRNDAIDANETRTVIEEKDLVIRDLGYFNLSVLMGFVEQKASFISRLNTTLLVFDPETNQPIEFKQLYDSMRRKKQTRREIKVLVGKDARKELRLIVDIVPDSVFQERIKKVNKENKKKGYQTSEEYKARCRFNLFITNVPAEEFSIEEVILLYRLRWQVELMFKNWKSVCKIDKIQPMKYERFTCLLYAKLILIMINLQIICSLQAHFFKTRGRVLSENKCFKTLGEKFEHIRGIWKRHRMESEKSMKALLKQFSQNHWKEKRKGKKNLLEIIDLFICKSKLCEYI